MLQLLVNLVNTVSRNYENSSRFSETDLNHPSTVLQFWIGDSALMLPDTVVTSDALFPFNGALCFCIFGAQSSYGPRYTVAPYGIFGQWCNGGQNLVKMWLRRDFNPCTKKNNSLIENMQWDITQKPNTRYLLGYNVGWWKRLFWWCVFTHVGLYHPICPLLHWAKIYLMVPRFIIINV